MRLGKLAALLLLAGCGTPDTQPATTAEDIAQRIGCTQLEQIPPQGAADAIGCTVGEVNVWVYTYATAQEKAGSVLTTPDWPHTAAVEGTNWAMLIGTNDQATIRRLRAAAAD